ncbi:unnamed protein product [Sphagnum tenellum]
MCFYGDLFAFELWATERYFVEDEKQEGSVPADLRCGHDGAVICIEAVQGYGLVAQRTEGTQRDLTLEASPEIHAGSKMMCIVGRT